MSVDRVSGEWRVADLFLMDGGSCVVSVSLCRYFSNVRVCSCRANITSGTDGWSLVRLTYLGECGWK